MNSNDFEQELKRRPLRNVPPEWKREILRTASAQKKQDSRSSSLRKTWLHELLWPSPVAWGTLAAVWVAIAGINVAMRDNQDSKPVAQTDYAQLRLALEQRRGLEAELAEPPVSPKPDVLKPRSHARPQSASA